jgi:hypothetical protein
MSGRLTKGLKASVVKVCRIVLTTLDSLDEFGRANNPYHMARQMSIEIDNLASLYSDAKATSYDGDGGFSRWILAAHLLVFPQ